MMIDLTKKNLLKVNFKDIDETKIDPFFNLIDNVDNYDGFISIIESSFPDTKAYISKCYNDPVYEYRSRLSVLIMAADEMLKTFGTETLDDADDADWPRYEYCNTGDTYALTIMLDRDDNRLFISSWGDVAEMIEDEDEDEDED